MQFVLVSKGPHHLRYLATNIGEGGDFGTIQAEGLGDADVALEDAVVAGPLKSIVDAAYASQAEARRGLLDDGLANGDPDLTNVPLRAITTVQGKIVPAGEGDFAIGAWAVDANVVGGRAVVEVACDQTTAQESPIAAYVDIRFNHSLVRV